MVSVPSFLLRRLYVKQSLKNATGGFEFQLKNGLGSGYAHKMSPLKLDGDEIPMDAAFFYLDGQEVAFSSVSKEKNLHAGDEQGDYDMGRRRQAGAGDTQGRDGLRRAGARHAAVRLHRPRGG